MVHTNKVVAEEPLFFCSKKCYQRWIRDIQQKKIKTYSLWKVDSFLGKKRFIKQIIQTKGTSQEYGPSTKNSHFSKKL